MEAHSSPSTRPGTTLEAEKHFDWPLCYEAEQLVASRIETFLTHNQFAQTLSRRMADGTGTLLIDWVDHLVVAAADEESFRQVGFVADPHAEAEGNLQALHHPDALLPRILIEPGSLFRGHPSVLAVRVDSVSDFLAAHRLALEPEGTPLARYRQALISLQGDARCYAIERRGYRGYVPGLNHLGETEALLKAKELWQTRPRHLEEANGYRQTQKLLDRMIDSVGRDLACHIVFEGERSFWEKRNRAARCQKERQDQLGLGWANHDHHTFRSSRLHFVDLMAALEKLGFERRERYYTGSEAGWGAQILEQPIEGIVAFCDVDLTPEETEIDFSREPLSPSRKLGTIGLWVGLHGESFLDAGMHHLECRFNYALLRQQLAALNINTMKPFSDLPFLKQAFTEGEKWPVSRPRAERLRAQGLIDEQQFQQFIKDGAIGSHLENLQRHGGFKGFNQKSVSVIIAATDPRQQHYPREQI